jgi:hypothetical protein
MALELVEGEDELIMVNQLREDVARWRDSGWEGATPLTKELLRYWSSPDRPRRLFFCQLEAVETVIYLREILTSGKRPRFNPQFPASDLRKLVDAPASADFLPLTRFGCKMATGSGKTVVMAMLIAWAFCNRGRNTSDERFPSAVLVCCPNLTVKERLQVLRPDRADNYFAAFDIVPAKLRPLMQNGKVLIENWHTFAPESEHAESGRNFPVVNKGAETPEAFARRILKELDGLERMPIMVLNDEAHHCYRPAPLEEKLSGEEAKAATHILGLRAFGSQLLCEQVVGRGLRRMDYTVRKDPETGKELLTEEYVDVYGIPFTVIPFKGRPVNKKEPEDKPKNHVRALPERAQPLQAIRHHRRCRLHHDPPMPRHTDQPHQSGRARYRHVGIIRGLPHRSRR